MKGTSSTIYEIFYLLIPLHPFVWEEVEIKRGEQDRSALECIEQRIDAVA